MIGTRVYNWALSDGRTMSVEYTFSSVNNMLVVVDMSIDGKYHRWNWMSYKGRTELMNLLEEDFESFYGITLTNRYDAEIERAA
tara:strand:+ start:138 stop:389 length:252 start_codon:yes stop_codon:yes gene_type:complete